MSVEHVVHVMNGACGVCMCVCVVLLGMYARTRYSWFQSLDCVSV